MVNIDAQYMHKMTKKATENCQSSLYWYRKASNIDHRTVAAAVEAAASAWAEYITEIKVKQTPAKNIDHKFIWLTTLYVMVC